MSVRALVDWVNNITSLRSRNGKYIHKSGIYRILRNPFYTGNFYYKDILYKGNYDPLITDQLFAHIQEKLRPVRTISNRISSQVSLSKFLYCRLCGSPLSSSGQFRKLISGHTRSHRWYVCNRQKDSSCTAKYVTEEAVLQHIASDIQSRNVTSIEFPEYVKEDICRFERIIWAIYRQLTNSHVRFSIYPLGYESLNEDAIRLYLQCTVLYSEPDKRHMLLSLLNWRFSI